MGRWILRFLSMTMLVGGVCAADEMRRWTDSTGKFEIRARFLQLRDGLVILRTDNGKTMTIPMKRLSDADQRHVEQTENPFKQADTPRSKSDSPNTLDASKEITAPEKTGNQNSVWRAPPTIDWGRVEKFDRGFGTDQWNFQPPPDPAFSLTPQRAVLPKKRAFFEHLKSLRLNPVAGRAVLGYLQTFSIPEPLTRVALVDVQTGDAMDPPPVKCQMVPMAVLNDGKRILMRGDASQSHHRYPQRQWETSDQLQLWTVESTQIQRSATWVPFANLSRSFGKESNSAVKQAIPLAGDHVLLLSDQGRIARFDLRTLTPVWYGDLGSDHAVEITHDQKQLVILEKGWVLVVDADTGKTRCKMPLPPGSKTTWASMRLGGDRSDQLLMSLGGELRILDLSAGEFLGTATSGNGIPSHTQDLTYLDHHYAMLGTRLYHLPSSISVCDYQGIAALTSIGGVEFVAVSTSDGGLLAPTSLPHRSAMDRLDQAVNDPEVFLIHPGVEVSVNVDAVAQEYREEVEANLRRAIKLAGYQVVSNAPITVTARISEPETKAVSYIARGSYVVTEYQSSIQIRWQDRTVWQSSSSNIPAISAFFRGPIQEQLDQLSKHPNTKWFQTISLPRLRQPPRGKRTSSGSSLTSAEFTLHGLVEVD